MSQRSSAVLKQRISSVLDNIVANIAVAIGASAIAIAIGIFSRLTWELIIAIIVTVLQVLTMLTIWRLMSKTRRPKVGTVLIDESGRTYIVDRFGSIRQLPDWESATYLLASLSFYGEQPTPATYASLQPLGQDLPSIKGWRLQRTPEQEMAFQVWSGLQFRHKAHEQSAGHSRIRFRFEYKGTDTVVVRWIGLTVDFQIPIYPTDIAKSHSPEMRGSTVCILFFEDGRQDRIVSRGDTFDLVLEMSRQLRDQEVVEATTKRFGQIRLLGSVNDMQIEVPKEV